MKPFDLLRRQTQAELDKDGALKEAWVVEESLEGCRFRDRFRKVRYEFRVNFRDARAQTGIPPKPFRLADMEVPGIETSTQE